MSHGDDIAVIGNASTRSIDPHNDDVTALGQDLFRYTTVYSESLTALGDAGGSAMIDLEADAGTDNDDKWHIQVADGGDFTTESFANGLYTPVFTINNSGNVTIPGELRANSDVRLKKNIKDVANAVELIDQMEPKSYEWKAFLDKEPGTQYGLIAQDVEKFAPELVSENEEGVKFIAYQELIPLLVDAVKQLSTENNAMSLTNYKR